MHLQRTRAWITLMRTNMISTNSIGINLIPKWDFTRMEKEYFLQNMVLYLNCRMTREKETIQQMNKLAKPKQLAILIDQQHVKIQTWLTTIASSQKHQEQKWHSLTIKSIYWLDIIEHCKFLMLMEDPTHLWLIILSFQSFKYLKTIILYLQLRKLMELIWTIFRNPILECKDLKIKNKNIKETTVDLKQWLNK